jgi:hypothetical protein
MRQESPGWWIFSAWEGPAYMQNGECRTSAAHLVLNICPSASLLLPGCSENACQLEGRLKTSGAWIVDYQTVHRDAYLNSVDELTVIACVVIRIAWLHS